MLHQLFISKSELQAKNWPYHAHFFFLVDLPWIQKWWYLFLMERFTVEGYDSLYMCVNFDITS